MWKSRNSSEAKPWMIICFSQISSTKHPQDFPFKAVTHNSVVQVNRMMPLCTYSRIFILEVDICNLCLNETQDWTCLMWGEFTTFYSTFWMPYWLMSAPHILTQVFQTNIKPRIYKRWLFFTTLLPACHLWDPGTDLSTVTLKAFLGVDLSK